MSECAKRSPAEVIVGNTCETPALLHAELYREYYKTLVYEREKEFERYVLMRGQEAHPNVQ